MSDTVKIIERIKPPYPFEAYAHTISQITAEDGGGYLISFPDIPGCISDGETEADAVENGRDAFLSVISALAECGHEIPAPSFQPQNPSEKLIDPFPEPIRERLKLRAEADGVSVYELVLALVADGLGRRSHTA